jgi:hypothetical protein
MTPWIAIFVASAAVYSWKIFGYLVPETVLDNPKVAKIANLLTVALLSALTGIEALTSSNRIEFDARIPALLTAALLLRFKAPFVVTVAAAAAVAALIRLL